MKSLVLKDLFNIGHNAKSMLFILVAFAAAFIPFSGVEGYIFECAILCSMMIVTTFSITINMEPDMAASHIPFQLVPKLQ